MTVRGDSDLSFTGKFMQFNRHFFDELRTLIRPVIEQIDPESFRPSVTELYNAGIVSHGFLNTLGDLVKGVYKAGYKLSPSFRAYPQHICTFPDGKAFRRQINIGFYAGDDPALDHVRIGLGFPMNLVMSQNGIDDYVDFVGDVAERPAEFDAVFSSLGGNAEPEHLLEALPLSSAVLTDKPDFTDDWRFYGKRLTRTDDEAALSSMDGFIREAVSVFDKISKAGFV